MRPLVQEGDRRPPHRPQSQTTLHTSSTPSTTFSAPPLRPTATHQEARPVPSNPRPRRLPAHRTPHPLCV
eukprot:1489281-Prymnesium_polylepis.1